MPHIKWLVLFALITGIFGSMADAGDEIFSLRSVQALPAGTSSPRNDRADGTHHNDSAEEAINIPDVIATVNGVNIKRQELERRMAQSRSMNPERFEAMTLEQKKKAMARTIDNMILREVIYQEAVKRNIVVTEEEVNLELENLKKQFPSGKEFDKTFAEYNITIPAWKVETRRKLMGIKLEEQMVSEIKISDQEIADFYEKNKKDLNMGPNESLKDHREHVRSILQQVKWQQLKSTWVNGLLAMYKIWKWAP